MMNKQSESKLQEAIDRFDFVRFTWSDIHGMHKGKSFPKRHVADMWMDGVYMMAGMQAFGPMMQLVNFPEVNPNIGYPNMCAMPIRDTLHEISWASQPGARVGEVLCENLWPIDQSHGACTRSMARRMVEQLDQEFGLRIKSAVELEFVLHRQDTGKPVYTEHGVYSQTRLAEFEPLFYEMDTLMNKGGIDVESFMTEDSEGQFEVTTSPAFGLDAADQTFLLRQGIREITRQRGLATYYMTKPYDYSPVNGLHFNHSLWDVNSTSIMYDDSDVNRISDQMKHWLSGLVHHAQALTALCCPTVNCYRRLHLPFSPNHGNWGIDHRLSTFRVKNYSAKATYIENRLPSAAANPYIVLAATLAAGMDGLRNRYPLAQAMDPQAHLLPNTLDEALQALEKDKIIESALGEMFVNWFLTEKRIIEVKELGGHDPKDKTNMEAFEKERKMYAAFI